MVGRLEMNSLINQKDFDINDIIKILPHRYPFILIDRINIIEKGKSLVALKNMTINEPFFQGHFPGQPVMPGVLSLEIMAQAGSFLMLSQIKDPLSMNMFFSTVESAKFRKPITPGDQLKVHMELAKRKLNLCKFHGKCYVDDTLVAEAKFAANLVDRARE